jgi:gamma-glutamyl:cysteine ligase YbdK (ATP-grasp superfamily)
VSAARPLRLFDGVGVELEYMIVDSATLDVRPVADELLRTFHGTYDTEVERGAIGWSNELALHVIELKTAEPVPSLTGLARQFQAEVADALDRLAPMRARLLPTATHPWMDPHRELRLWPHGYDDVYQAFNRIFDCRGHGWANLQSVHVNLPFGDDEEFARLHAAIRMVLPIVPALAASSPMVDGRLTGLLDTRLDVYRHNADRVPSVAGQVIPEPATSRQDYEARILGPIYDDLAPLDPDGVLRHEWVNGRGCIARFDRMALEIRVIDAQECPIADVAVAVIVAGAVRALVEGRWTDPARLRDWSDAPLQAIFLDAIRDGDQAVVRDGAYLAALGLPARGPRRTGEIWQHLIETTLGSPDRDEARSWLDQFTRHGCLARRIITALGPATTRDRVAEVYRRLADCLALGVPFDPTT